MVLNLLAMLYSRRLMGGATVMALQILGAVLGVLQVALRCCASSGCSSV
jgi:hypothetical protein